MGKFQLNYIKYFRIQGKGKIHFAEIKEKKKIFGAFILKALVLSYSEGKAFISLQVLVLGVKCSILLTQFWDMTHSTSPRLTSIQNVPC